MNSVDKFFQVDPNLMSKYRSSWQCHFPIILWSDKDNNEIDRIVPCGKCHFCKMKRSSQWTSRLLFEANRWQYKYHIILTYDEKSLPGGLYSDQDGNLRCRERSTLDRTHPQLYLKRLRNHCRPWSLKYYGVGEYGKRGTLRPHYHLLIFSEKPIKGQVFTDCWPRGHVYVTKQTPENIAYVARYCAKKQAGDGTLSALQEFELQRSIVHRREYLDGRLREFNMSSQCLGDNYLTPQRVEWHRRNLITYCVRPHSGGIKCSLPRRWYDFCFGTDEMKEKLKIRQESLEMSDEVLTLGDMLLLPEKYRKTIYNDKVEEYKRIHRDSGVL